jgi:hypothetical protein
MAHQWRKPLCADDEMRLVKSMALFECAIAFCQRRINGASAHKTCPKP